MKAIYSRKIRLKPTKEQEIQFRKSAGTSRWAYNYTIEEDEKIRDEYFKNNKEGPYRVDGGDVRKRITQLKKTTHPWLNEVSCNVPKQAVKDACRAIDEWISGEKGKPHKKKKSDNDLSFYVNYESLKAGNMCFQGEKLGWIKTCENLPKLHKGEKYSNPHVTFDGQYWYLSVGVEYDIKPPYDLTDVKLGIDLGLKMLAVLSIGKEYPNMNKTLDRIKLLEKRLKREQRKLSRKLEGNIIGYEITDNGYRKPIFARPLHECKNYQKQKKEVNKIHKQLKNIRTNFIHQITTEIVKTKPSRIVMEDLNIKGMLKNKHLSKAISKAYWYEFKRQIQYKCKKYGIEFVEAKRTYASSKICSRCGHKKKHLKLSERTYVCEECGLVIDRDLNAAINLANYEPPIEAQS